MATRSLAGAPLSMWAFAFEKALEALNRGDAVAAREMLVKIAQLEPGNQQVIARLHQAECAIEMAARDRGLADQTVLKLNVTLHSLVGQTVSPAESFVLSRFARGPLAVEEVVTACAFAPCEVLHILHRFLEREILRRVD